MTSIIPDYSSIKSGIRPWVTSAIIMCTSACSAENQWNYFFRDCSNTALNELCHKIMFCLLLFWNLLHAHTNVTFVYCDLMNSANLKYSPTILELGTPRLFNLQDKIFQYPSCRRLCVLQMWSGPQVFLCMMKLSVVLRLNLCFSDGYMFWTIHKCHTADSWTVQGADICSWAFRFMWQWRKWSIHHDIKNTNVWHWIIKPVWDCDYQISWWKKPVCHKNTSFLLINYYSFHVISMSEMQPNTEIYYHTYNSNTYNSNQSCNENVWAVYSSWWSNHGSIEASSVDLVLKFVTSKSVLESK